MYFKLWVSYISLMFDWLEDGFGLESLHFYFLVRIVFKHLNGHLL